MKPLIESIEIKNYKAFKSGSIHFSPISVMLGTNSSGKSSLIKLILMLSQSSNSNKNKNNFLITHGELADLGDVKNIFFNQEDTNPIDIKFNLIEPIDISNYLKIIIKEILYMIEKISRQFYFSLKDINKNRTHHYRDKVLTTLSLIRKARSNDTDEYRHETLMDIIDLSLSSARYIEKNYVYDVENPARLSEIEEQEEVLLILDDSNSDKFPSTLDYLKEIKSSLEACEKLKSFAKITSISYKISSRNNELLVDAVRLNNSQDYLEISFWNTKTNRSHINVSSNTIDTSEFVNKKSRIKDLITFSNFEIKNKKSKFNLPSNPMAPSQIRRHVKNTGNIYVLYAIFGITSQRVKRSFSTGMINHVSPLRFTPDRYFLMDNKNNGQSNISNSGRFLLEVLNDKPELKKEVNKWLKKFDLEVDVDDITHIIHSIKIKDSGLSLDITDVGFGVSQILPVILQSVMARHGSLTIIEQPEIHIHPKMQSALADFFIEQSQCGEKRFLIETHSEALLKRLRRRMAEYNSNKELGISHQDVNIHFVEKRKDKRSGAKITNIDITPSGSFEWPKDFKENDIIDTIEFMKHQG
ncbi:hypothetical protein ACS83_02985 [Vibrio alginolyticus]|uniref:AAA family ATPase n=2 Tax=Vibrio harveyi group TaxID=717610 RepID=UPI0006A639D9|nr:AAA family ATPase [Vibrio alginolyticus]KOE07704.1 hypothetical protein ACS83_02985 [Vibrio alginolyticus]